MSLQNTITNVIVKYGEDITFTLGQTEVYSEDDGWSNTGGTVTIAKCVPYEYFENRWSPQDIGNLPVGDIKLITVHSIDVGDKDKFVYRSKNYELVSINPLPFQGSVLAQVLVANEILENESEL